MKKLAAQFGLKASLHDIPNVYANGFNQPKKMTYPIYSTCTEENWIGSEIVSFEKRFLHT